MKTRRILLLGGLLLAAVLAFLLLKPGSSQESVQSTVTESRIETAATQQPETKEKVDRVVVQNCGADGAIAKVKAVRNQLVRIKVTSDCSDELHLHGYDLSKHVAQGKPAYFKFKAKIEGVFEIELEKRGLQVASLTVSN